MTEETKDRCMACGVELIEGDEFLFDISGDVIHFACCGPELEGFVDLGTGEPLGRKPVAQIWSAGQ